MAGEDDDPKTDLTVYGATGFSGKHICRYLIRAAIAHEQPLKITLAGRNESKLKDRMEFLLQEEKEGNKTFFSLDVFVADSKDGPKLKEMTKRSRVVLCSAGPFRKYASLVVAACAETGTDYVDITGEVGWAGKMRQRYGPTAGKSGARIVSLCGFDSVPSDLSVFAAVQALRDVRGPDVPIDSATTHHVAMGAANGGTVQTLVDIPIDIPDMLFDSNSGVEGKTLRTVPYFINDPLILTHPTKVRHNPSLQLNKYRLALGEWRNQIPCLERFLGWGMSLPFLMAPANDKVVHASAMALNYGPNFVYFERFLPFGFQTTRTFGILLAFPTLFTHLMMGLFFLFVRTPYIGKLFVDTFLPPGSGMPDYITERGYAQVYASVTSPASGNTVDRATCFMAFSGDPGNLVTAQCLSESALTLLLDRSKLPPRSEDGFGSPAEILGQALLERLRHNKVRPVEIYTSVQKNDSKSPTKFNMYGS